MEVSRGSTPCSRLSPTIGRWRSFHRTSHGDSRSADKELGMLASSLTSMDSCLPSTFARRGFYTRKRGVMEEQPLTPEQQAAAEAIGREFLWQLERVAVDMQAAFPRLREIAPPVERQISEDE